MTTGRASATAFAPASVGNVAVGFDVLGLSVSALGDRVRAARRTQPGVGIRSIRGVVQDLPLTAERNTAGMAVIALQRDLGLSFGFELEIDKGIPLGSGLGGSAASAVAGVVAAAALLEHAVPIARSFSSSRCRARPSRAARCTSTTLRRRSSAGSCSPSASTTRTSSRFPCRTACAASSCTRTWCSATREARAILRDTVDLVGRNLAAGQSRRVPGRLLHLGSDPDSRVAARRRHRAAAPGAHPGLRRRQGGRARGGRARLLDLRGGSQRVRLGARRGGGRRARRRWSRRSPPRPRRPTAGSPRSTRSGARVVAD